MAVSRRLRYEILRRDEHTCRYCGGKAPDVALQVDHVVPTTLGGSDDPSNLVAACRDCNAGKSSVSPDAPMVEQVKSDALAIATALSQAAEERCGDIRKMMQMGNRVYKAWLYEWEPDDWRNTLERFYMRGLDADVLEHIMRKACGNSDRKANHAWLWFCKVCWAEITKIEAAATGPVVPLGPSVETVVEHVAVPMMPRRVRVTQWGVECEFFDGITYYWSNHDDATEPPAYPAGTVFMCQFCDAEADGKWLCRKCANDLEDAYGEDTEWAG